MKLFKCQRCAQLLYFENVRCERCSHRLGYMPEANVLSALEPESGDEWRPLAAPDRRRRFCANAAHEVCNWLVSDDSPETYCIACRHNRTIPALSQPSDLLAWTKMESAKHHLFYTLLKLKLPLENRIDDPEHGLAFDFLADPPDWSPRPKVMTGHEEGLITISLAEADDGRRESRRMAMGEPYRTLLGHFRHEVGHHFWDRLVADDPRRLAMSRDAFGDERADYGEALQRHYSEGPPADWRERFVSAYASTHPWEDFAETWAHYLHIVDTLEMAASFGVSINPPLDPTGAFEGAVDFDPYQARDAAMLIAAWLPLTLALNSLNRSMGQPDLYPFVLSLAVVEKLGVIHDLIHGS